MPTSPGNAYEIPTKSPQNSLKISTKYPQNALNIYSLKCPWISYKVTTKFLENILKYQQNAHRMSTIFQIIMQKTKQKKLTSIMEYWLENLPLRTSSFGCLFFHSSEETEQPPVFSFTLQFNDKLSLKKIAYPLICTLHKDYLSIICPFSATFLEQMIPNLLVALSYERLIIKYASFFCKFLSKWLQIFCPKPMRPFSASFKANDSKSFRPWNAHKISLFQFQSFQCQSFQCQSSNFNH